MTNDQWQLGCVSQVKRQAATLALSISIQLPPDIESMLRRADTAFCGILFLDFLVLLRLARDKRKYLITWGWIDLLSSTPLIPALQLGRLARMLRILRVIGG
jgi:voltage-gated potassium channel